MLAACFSDLVYHVVVVTSQRRPFLVPPLSNDLTRHVSSILRDHGGELIEAAALPDHLHLLLRLGTEHSLAAAIALVKTTSAARLRRAANGGGFAWQPGFAAFTVGAGELVGAIHGLRGQDRRHRNHTLTHELLGLAQHHRVRAPT